MAEYTTNYDLVKPAQEDFYNVDDQNRNMDKIDAALKAHDDALSGKADLGEDGKVKPEQLPDSTFDPTQDIEDAINEHNTSDSAHADIREDVAAALEASQNAQDAADAALEAVSGFVYTIDVVPTQNGTLTYNGQSQTPSWNSYNPDTLTLGGVTTPRHQCGNLYGNLHAERPLQVDGWHHHGQTGSMDDQQSHGCAPHPKRKPYLYRIGPKPFLEWL